MPSNTAIADATPPRKIVLVIFDQAKLLDITGPMQVFNDARFENGHSAYQIVLASEKGGAIATDAGVTLQSLELSQVMSGDVDTMLIAGGQPAESPAATEGLRGVLAKYVDQPRRLGSICVGAFILAQLGVLNGREVTTHWGKSKLLENEYPGVRVKSDAIFVTSDRVWTSAGVSAGIDMALAMVEDDLGSAAALSLARDLVLFLKRPGGQSQFSVELRRQTHDAKGRFDELHDWIRSNLSKDLSVSALASAARMSPRNFARVYSRETGESPAKAVEQIRVEAARRLLETATDSIQQIANRIGFGDDERMRRAFLKAYGVSPLDYRNRFGRSRDDASPALRKTLLEA
ncbi:GlxA family transcriptional regulator [Rhizobium mesoamericanum]|uniref:GlxA family transcriptional regulator n=1 Tax=Rhizobium mesoamericanum TaxID=1079800 RepID=UPI00040AFC32|nr:DJ-1/PfpI family protein [Rhizobium mesoamericanum]